MSDYKVIPVTELNGKYEINADGIVRNVKTLKVTQVHHTSKKLGPVVSLISGGKSVRLSVLVLVKDLFGTAVTGWEDIDLGARVEPKVVKTRLTPEVKAARAEAKAKAAEARVAEKAALLAKAKATADKIRAERELTKLTKEAKKKATVEARAATKADEAPKAVAV
jgi:L-fucose isomerase-like protein